MRSTLSVLLLVVPLCAAPAISSAQPVPDYVALRASLASLYGLELGQWAGAFGTKDQSAHESRLRELARSLDLQVADSIWRAKTRAEAVDAIIVQGSGAAYGFRLQRVEFVYLAYMIGSAVGMIKVHAGAKESYAGVRGHVDKIMESMVLFIDGMNLDPRARADMQVQLLPLKNARTRKELAAGADGLIRWHTLFLSTIAPPGKANYELAKRLQAGVLFADLKALQWGMLRGDPAAAGSLADIGKYFGVNPALDDRAMIDVVFDTLLPEQRQYYWLGKAAGDLIFLRRRHTDPNLPGKPIDAQTRAMVSRSLNDVKTNASGVGAPEHFLNSLGRIEADANTANTLGDLLKVLDDRFVQWYSDLAHSLGDRM